MWLDRLKQYLGLGCLVFLAVMTFRSFGMTAAAMQRNDRLGAVLALLAALLWAAAAGVTFVLLYLRGIAEDMIDTLLAPRRFRERPAPLITPVEVMIREERFEAARERLEAMLEADPDVPLLWLMRFDLLRGPLHSPEEAMRTAERYFVRPDRLRSDDNAKLALRYAELARELGRQNEAIRFLTAELRRRGTRYSRAERALLANMLEALNKNDIPRMQLE